jgi:hypothetical protein
VGTNTTADYKLSTGTAPADTTEYKYYYNVFQ